MKIRKEVVLQYLRSSINQLLQKDIMHRNGVAEQVAEGGENKENFTRKLSRNCSILMHAKYSFFNDYISTFLQHKKWLISIHNKSLQFKMHDFWFMVYELV